MSWTDDAEWTEWLAAQRHRALNAVLILVMVTGFAGLIVSVVAALRDGNTHNLPYYATSYVAILAIFFARGLSDLRRAQLFLMLMYAFALFSFYAGWLAGGGRVFLLAMIVVASLLAGPKTSLSVFLVSFATYAAFGISFNRGWLQLRDLPDPISPSPILIEGVGFIMAISMVAISQWFFGQALKAATRASEEAEAERVKAATYARQLEIANQELEAFSYSVSHDLRAPLRAINGFSQALEEDIGKRLTASELDLLHRLRAGAVNMSGLIDGLLKLSRLSQADLTIEHIDLTTLAVVITRELQERDPERHVTFSIAPALTEKGDPDLIKLALRNLLDNAWKFSSKKAKARIEFGEVELDGEQAFFIRDNGAGFDMAHMGKLFGPFQRLHKSNEFPGIGIGLATVMRILRRHGGRIWAISEVDHGATFYFTLQRQDDGSPRTSSDQWMSRG